MIKHTEVKRVGLLARVSSRSQEDNTSLDNQIRKTREFAKQHGYEIVTEEREIITGAARWGARTGFNRQLELGDRGLIDAIVVDVPDRLGRGRAQATLVDRAEQHRLKILCADGSTLDAIELGVNIIKSGGERENISRRTKEGKQNSARNGNIVPAFAPYGYKICRRYDEKTGKKLDTWLEFDPGEIEHVRNIFHWLVYERLSLKGIAERLHELGVSTRRGNKRWQRSTIRCILSNEGYTGRWPYNVRKTKLIEDGDRVRSIIEGKRDASEWIYIDIPRAIDDSLFKSAQAILGQNQKQFSGRPSRRKDLLKGILFCACGRKMGGRAHRDTADYQCTREDESHPRIRVPIADGLVWDKIKELMRDPENLLAEYEQRQAEKEKQHAILHEQIESIQAEILKTERQLNNLLDQFLADDMGKERYRRKEEELENFIREKQTELTKAQAQLSEKSPTQADRAQFKDFCDSIKDKLETLSFEKKRQLLLLLDVRVTFLADQDILLVQGAFPSEKLDISRTSYVQFMLTIPLSSDQNSLSLP